MYKRKESKLEMKKKEEEEMDRKLREAKMYEQDMDFETKAMLLNFLEDSRESARQEERNRQNLHQKEQEILSEAINKSCGGDSQRAMEVEEVVPEVAVEEGEEEVDPLATPDTDYMWVSPSEPSTSKHTADPPSSSRPVEEEDDLFLSLDNQDPNEEQECQVIKSTISSSSSSKAVEARRPIRRQRQDSVEEIPAPSATPSQSTPTPSPPSPLPLSPIVGCSKVSPSTRASATTPQVTTTVTAAASTTTVTTTVTAAASTTSVTTTTSANAVTTTVVEDGDSDDSDVILPTQDSPDIHTKRLPNCHSPLVPRSLNKTGSFIVSESPTSSTSRDSTDILRRTPTCSLKEKLITTTKKDSTCITKITTYCPQKDPIPSSKESTGSPTKNPSHSPRSDLISTPDKGSTSLSKKDSTPSPWKISTPSPWKDCTPSPWKNSTVSHNDTPTPRKGNSLSSVKDPSLSSMKDFPPLIDIPLSPKDSVTPKKAAPPSCRKSLCLSSEKDIPVTIRKDTPQSVKKDAASHSVKDAASHSVKDAPSLPESSSTTTCKITSTTHPRERALSGEVLEDPAPHSQDCSPSSEIPDASSSDSEEKYSVTMVRKRNLDVFSLKTPTHAPLKRKHPKISEKAGGQYHLGKSESLKQCRQRILHLMDAMFQRLQQHQDQGDLPPMCWPPPLLMDKRVKNSLDRPRRVTKRRQLVEHEVEEELDSQQCSTRQTSRIRKPEASSSQDLLPSLDTEEEGARTRRQVRNRVLNVGLRRGRKVVQQPRVEEAAIHTDSQANVEANPSSPASAPSSENWEDSPLLFPVEECDTVTNCDTNPVSDGDNQEAESAATQSRRNPPTPEWSTTAKVQKLPRRRTFQLSIDSDSEEDCQVESSIPQPPRTSTRSGRGRASPNPDAIPVGQVGSPAPTNKIITTDGVNSKVANSNTDSTSELCIIEEEHGNPGPSTLSRRATRRPMTEPIYPAPIKLKRTRTRNRDESQKTGQAAAEPSAFPQTSQSLTTREEVERMDAKGEEEEEEVREVVSCPICQKQFPKQQIEYHASDCVGAEESQQQLHAEVSQSQQGGRGPKRQRRMNQEVAGVSRADTREKKRGGVVEKHTCTLCKEELSSADDLLRHVKSCKRMKDIEVIMASSEDTTSPTSTIPREYRRRMEPSASGSGQEMQKRSSVFDYIEGVLEQDGDITSLEFMQPDTALVQVINCVAVRPHGLSETLARKYPYSDSYSKRIPVGKLNRAIKEARPLPGSILVCQSTRQQDPLVINVCGQFYMGKETRKNLHSKRLISQLQDGKGYPDPHLLSGLLQDTAYNRIRWFQNGLEDLTHKVSEHGNLKVTRVVFPAYIGCGLAGGNWQKDYLPAIHHFASQVGRFKVRVIIVRKFQKAPSHSDLAKKTSKQYSLHPKHCEQVC